MRKSDSLFFLTGAAALVYQTIWIRLSSRLFGSDAGGLAVVLAVFMGGMALGALLFAPLTQRTRKPVQLFAALELGLGVWAALSPLLFELADPVGAGMTRVFLAVLFLLPPTLVMGATFPLMARLTIRSAADTGSETSAFYGANTLGAAFGALLGPLCLMPFLGLTHALWAAALLDGLAAALAWRWLTRAEHETTTAVLPPASMRLGADSILVSTFLIGLCGLGLEVLLSRILVTVTGSSVYAYAIVLSVFLLGIGLGSRQLVAKASGGAATALRADLRTLALAALAIPGLTFGGLLALRWQLGETSLFGALQNRMPIGASVGRLWASHALFAALALLPPALALGAALPSAAAAYAERQHESLRERALARVYTANTAGALVGALFAGFVLLPRFGPEAALYPLLGMAWAAGTILTLRAPRAWLVSGLGACLLAFWLHGGPAQRAGTDELYLEHDAHATVSVEESAEAEGAARTRSLRVNGKVVATTVAVDLRLQRLLGHIPGLLHGDVKRALVIGLGTGMTAGSLLDLPSLERLDVYEISSAVPGAARQFADWNGHVLDDARTQLRVADGRHALATSATTWDLITSDPIHPWTRGSSDLYALEHFQAMAAHLAPGGVASQWLPLYQLATEDVQTVIATWCAAFPHTSAWLTAYDLALVGSMHELPALGASSQELPARVTTHLAQAGVHSLPELAALQVADDAELRAYGAHAAPMLDDRPSLEFRAPFSFLKGYASEVLAWAGRDSFVPSLPVAARARALEVRRELRTFLEQLPTGWSAAARRYGDALLALPPL